MTATPEDTDHAMDTEGHASETQGDRPVPPEADRGPTADEEAAADKAAADVDLDRVAAHEKEMAEKGKNVKGEGEIE